MSKWRMIDHRKMTHEMRREGERDWTPCCAADVIHACRKIGMKATQRGETVESCWGTEYRLRTTEGETI